jgi:hypothetical protein
MTNQERVENVKSLGYSDREATFVTLAALHSGYFLRRQYAAFAGKSWGWADDALTSKVLANRHARELATRCWRTVYSFQSKSLFEALGEVDNRNRRLHEPQTIKARLMALDYVISHPDVTWFPTERERISLFEDQLKIEREHLPVWRYGSKTTDAATLRWFVDKPPIYVAGSEARVHFCFADPGFHTADSFASFLRNYRPLFGRLEGFKVIYIAEASHPAERARRIFTTFFSPVKTMPEDPLVGDLLTYFKDRFEHESAGLAAFDMVRLNRYRECRKQFAAERFQRLFEGWKKGPEGSVRRAVSPDSSDQIGERAAFSVTLVQLNYGRAGRSSRRSDSSGGSSGSSSPPVASYV